jgi:hypothetical protein
VRFDKEARAAIREASPGAATIKWPAGAPEPEKGRVYWMQSQEDAQEAEKKEKRHRQEHPETHAEVMAQMHERRYGTKPAGHKPKRRRSTRRPVAEDPRIIVLSVTILQHGWEATVALYEAEDPVRHLRMKARVPAGPNPIDGFHEPTETESEQIITAPSRAEREDAEESLRIESAASADRAELARLERKLASERRKGRPGKQAKMALERARRRVEQQSAVGVG